MSSDQLTELEAGDLYSLLVLVLFCVGGMVLIHRGALPFLRFHRPSGPREPPLWGVAETLMCLLVWLMLQIVIGISVSPLQEALGAIMTQSIALCIANALACAYVLFTVKRTLGQPLSTLGLVRTPDRNLIPTLAFYPLCWITLGLVTYSWNRALHVFGHELTLQDPVRVFSAAVRAGDVGLVVLLVFAGAVMAPLVEEVLFRGLVFGWLRRRVGVLLAVIASSFLFAAIHLSLTALAPLFFLGCVLAYLYQRTGSVYPAMFFHALHNSVAFALIIATANE